jgi:hypothetical protein
LSPSAALKAQFGAALLAFRTTHYSFPVRKNAVSDLEIHAIRERFCLLGVYKVLLIEQF